MPVAKTDASEVTLVPPPAKDLFSWKAPARPFKKRDREYFTTIAAIVFLLVVILLFIKEWLLVGVIIAFMFFSYVLATVPPPQLNYKITTRGVFMDDKFYPWNQLYQFWFSEKWGNQIIHFNTLVNFPKQLQLIIEKNKKESIKTTVEKYLLFEEPKKTAFDKAALWLQEKFPLESS